MAGGRSHPVGVEVVGLGIMRPRPLARSVPGRRPPGAPAARRRRGRLDSRDVEHGAPSPTETWDEFFSEFYLRAYREAERNARAEEEALAAARLSGCPPGGDLLDVPCGFGRHSVPLAASGLKVTGVDRAQVLLDESAIAFRRRGDMWGYGSALGNLASLALARDDVREARRLLEESLVAIRITGRARWIAWILVQLAAVTRLDGQRERAATMAADALAIFQRLGDSDGEAACLRLVSPAGAEEERQGLHY